MYGRTLYERLCPYLSLDNDYRLLSLVNQKLKLFGVIVSKYSVGKEFVSKYGTARIIENLGKQRVKIKWLDQYGYEHIVKTSNLKDGKVQNPYAPMTKGVGFIGVGEYTPAKNKREHSVWSSMLIRAYDNEYKDWKPSYATVSVCADWLSFQNFARWCNLQAGFFEGGYHLDKDLLLQGNQVYSPETCRFVPAYVNTVLSGSAMIRGEWPLGVHKIKGSKTNSFYAQIKSGGKVPRYLGLHPTPSIAHNVWQLAKATQIEAVISMYQKEKVFDTYVADSLMCRVWKLRTDAATGVETVTL